jgi:hypothetical protein
VGGPESKTAPRPAHNPMLGSARSGGGLGLHVGGEQLSYAEQLTAVGQLRNASGSSVHVDRDADADDAQSTPINDQPKTGQVSERAASAELNASLGGTHVNTGNAKRQRVTHDVTQRTMTPATDPELMHVSFRSCPLLRLGQDLGFGVVGNDGIALWHVGDRHLEAAWKLSSILPPDECFRAVAAAAARCQDPTAHNTPVMLVVTQTDEIAAASARRGLQQPDEVWRVVVELRGKLCSTCCKIHVLHIVQLRLEVRHHTATAWIAVSTPSTTRRCMDSCLNALHDATLMVARRAFGPVAFSLLQLPDNVCCDMWHRHANDNRLEWPATDAPSSALAAAIRQLQGEGTVQRSRTCFVVFSVDQDQDQDQDDIANIDAVLLHLLGLPVNIVVCWKQHGMPLLHMRRPGHQRAHTAWDQHPTQELLVVCGQRLGVETLRLVCVRARLLGCSVSVNTTEQSRKLFKQGLLENPLLNGSSSFRTHETTCFACKQPISPLRPPAGPGVCEHCHDTRDNLLCTPCALEYARRHNLPVADVPRGDCSKVLWDRGVPQVHVICQSTQCKCGRISAAQQIDEAMELEPPPPGTGKGSSDFIMAAAHVRLLRTTSKQCVRPPTSTHVFQLLLLLDIVQAAGNIPRRFVPCEYHHLIEKAKRLAEMLRDLKHELIALLHSPLFRTDSGIGIPLRRDRAMDCREALEHFANVVRVSFPLWRKGDFIGLVHSLTKPAETGDFTLLQTSIELSASDMPSQLVRTHVLEAMSPTARATAVRAVEAMMLLPTKDRCRGLQTALEGFLVEPQYGPIPTDWWDEYMSADAAPVMHAKDLFDPFAKWHLANDGQWASGRAILWILQLMHALNAAELKYDELRADFQRLGFQVLRKRVQDAAMWAASGQRLGGGTPTMACHILATAQVEPSAILRWPELQHRILRGATQRDVLELIAAQEPAHYDQRNYIYDDFPGATSTRQSPLQSGVDLIHHYESASGVLSVRLILRIAGWRFARAALARENPGYVRNLAQAAAREHDIVNRLFYHTSMDDRHTYDRYGRMIPAIEWLRAPDVSGERLSDEQWQSLAYLSGHVVSFVDDTTHTLRQELPTATQIAEMRMATNLDLWDESRQPVALLVERIDDHNNKDHFGVVFVGTTSSPECFLLLDHTVPAGRPVRLDAEGVAQYLRGCQHVYAKVAIALVTFKPYQQGQIKCTHAEAYVRNFFYSSEYEPRSLDGSQRFAQFELNKNPTGSVQFTDGGSNSRVLSFGQKHGLDVLRCSHWTNKRVCEARWASLIVIRAAAELWSSEQPLFVKISTAVSRSDAHSCSGNQVWSFEPRAAAIAKDSLQHRAFLAPAASRWRTMAVTQQGQHYTRPAINSQSVWALTKIDPGSEKKSENLSKLLRKERCSVGAMDQVASSGSNQVASNTPFALDSSALLVGHPDKCKLPVILMPNAQNARFYPIVQLAAIMRLVDPMPFAPGQQDKLAGRICRTVFHDEAARHGEDGVDPDYLDRTAAVHEAERLGVRVHNARPRGYGRRGLAVWPDALMPDRQELNPSMMAEIKRAGLQGYSMRHCLGTDRGWLYTECHELIRYFLHLWIQVPERWSQLPPLFARWTTLPGSRYWSESPPSSDDDDHEQPEGIDPPSTLRRQSMQLLEHAGVNPCTQSDLLHRPSPDHQSSSPHCSAAVTEYHSWFVAADTTAERDFIGPQTQRQANFPQITPPMVLHTREGDLTVFSNKVFRADACFGGIEVHRSSASSPHHLDELPQSNVWQRTRQDSEIHPPHIEVASLVPARQLRSDMLTESGTRHGAYHQACKMEARRARLVAQSWPQSARNVTTFLEITSHVSRSVEPEHWGSSRMEVEARKELQEAGFMQTRHSRDAISAAGHKVTGANTLADLACHRCRHAQNATDAGTASLLDILDRVLATAAEKRTDPASCFFVGHNESMYVGKHSRLPHRTCECCRHELSEFTCSHGVLFFLSLTCSGARNIVNQYLKKSQVGLRPRQNQKRRCACCVAAPEDFIGNGMFAHKPTFHTRYQEIFQSPTLLEWVLSSKMDEHRPALLQHGLVPDYQHADRNLDSDRNKRISCVLAGQGAADTLRWALSKKGGMRQYPETLAAAAGAGRLENVRQCYDPVLGATAGQVLHGNAIVLAARSGHKTVLDALLPFYTWNVMTLLNDRGTVGSPKYNLYDMDGLPYQEENGAGSNLLGDDERDDNEIYYVPKAAQHPYQYGLDDLQPLMHGNSDGMYYSRSCAAAASGSWPASKACFLRLLETSPRYWDAPAVAAVAAAHGQLEFLQWSRSILTGDIVVLDQFALLFMLLANTV